MPNYFNVNNSSLNLSSESLTSSQVFAASYTVHDNIYNATPAPINIIPQGICTPQYVALNSFTDISAIDTIALNIVSCSASSTTTENFTIEVESVNNLTKNPSTGSFPTIVSDSPFPEYEPNCINFSNKSTVAEHIFIQPSNMGESSPLKAIGTGVYTLEMWVKITEWPAVTLGYVLFAFSQPNGLNSARLQVSLYGSSSTVRLDYYNTQLTSSSLAVTLNNPKKLQLNTWHHIALSVGKFGPHRARLFVDGEGTANVIVNGQEEVPLLSALNISQINRFDIGWMGSGLFTGNNWGLRGRISNFCYSSVAKYGDNFSVIYEPIQTDKTVRALYKYPYDYSFIGVNYSNISTKYALSSFASSQKTNTWAAFKLSSPISVKISDLSDPNVETVNSTFFRTRFLFKAPSNTITINCDPVITTSPFAGYTIFKLLGSSLTDKTTAIGLPDNRLSSTDGVFLLGTFTNSGLNTFTLTAASATELRNINIGMGATFVLPENATTTVSLSTTSTTLGGIRIGAGGKLISKPISHDILHIFRLGGCPIVVEGGGYAELIGSAKQQTLNLVSAAAVGARTLTLTNTPSTWRANDDILLFSNISGKSFEYHQISAISDTIPNTISTKTAVLSVHSPLGVVPDILNISRNIRLTSFPVNNKPGWVVYNDGCSALLNNVYVSGLNYGTYTGTTTVNVSGQQGFYFNTSNTSNITIDSCSFRDKATTTAPVMGVTYSPFMFNTLKPVFNINFINNSFCDMPASDGLIQLQPAVTAINFNFNNNIIAATEFLQSIRLNGLTGNNFNIKNNVFIDNAGVGISVVNNVSTTELVLDNIIGYRNNNALLAIGGNNTKINNIQNITSYYSRQGIHLNSLILSSLNINNIHTRNLTANGPGYGGIITLDTINASSTNITNISSINSNCDATIRLNNVNSNNTNITNINVLSNTGSNTNDGIQVLQSVLFTPATPASLILSNNSISSVQRAGVNLEGLYYSSISLTNNIIQGTSSTDRGGIYITNCNRLNNILLDQLTINNNIANGILLNNITSSNILFNRSSINNSNIGITIQNTPAGYLPITFNNLTITGNKLQGILLNNISATDIIISNSNFIQNSGVNIDLKSVNFLYNLSATQLNIEHANTPLGSVPAAASAISVTSCLSAYNININNNAFKNLGGGINLQNVGRITAANINNVSLLSSRGDAISFNTVSALSTETNNINLVNITATNHTGRGILLNNLINKFNLNINNINISSCNIGVAVQNNFFDINLYTNNITSNNNTSHGVLLQTITSFSSISTSNLYCDNNTLNGLVISGVSGINNFNIKDTFTRNNSANGIIVQSISAPANILINVDNNDISFNKQNGILIQNIPIISAVNLNKSILSNNLSAGVHLARLTNTSSPITSLSTLITEITANNNLIGIEAYNVVGVLSSNTVNNNTSHGVKAAIGDNLTVIDKLTCYMQTPTAINTSSIVFNTASSTAGLFISELSPAIPFQDNLYNSVYFTAGNKSTASSDRSRAAMLLSNTSSFNLSNQNFTIEAWVYVEEVGGYGGLIVGTSNAIHTGQRFNAYIGNLNIPLKKYCLDTWGLHINPDYTLCFSYNNTRTTTSTKGVVTSFAILRKVWNHIAVTRDSNKLFLYINGLSAATANITETINYDSTLPLRVGGGWYEAYTPAFNLGGLGSDTEQTFIIEASPAPNNVALGMFPINSIPPFYDGYISNLRITKNQALYTGSSYTVPAEPLTTTSQAAQPTNVSLLMGQNINVYKDNSVYSNIIQYLAIRGASIAINSNPINPFYNKTVWSGYFGNNTNYINLPSAYNTALSGFANNTITCEAWVYIKTLSATSFISNFAAGNFDGRYNFGTNIDNTLNFTYSTSTTTITAVSGTIPIQLNKWTHVAFTINATTPSASEIKLFVDGNSTTRAADFSTHVNLASASRIGGGVASINNRTIYNDLLISNFHITKEILYNNNFTPSLTPVISTNNTVLLTLQNNTFIDNSINQFALTSVAGLPSIQYSSPFISVSAPGSIFFNGNSDYITLSASDISLPIGSNIPFTIETWVFPVAHRYDSAYITDSSNGNLYFTLWPAAASNKQSNQTDNSLSFGYFTNVWAAAVQSSRGVVLNKWQHLAAVYTGSQLLLFIDGKLIGSSNASSWSTKVPSTFFIGKRWDDNPNTNNYFCGYMSNIRYIRGTALYKANFTPQTSGYTCISNTKFLLKEPYNKSYLFTPLSTVQSNIFLLSSYNTYPLIIKNSNIGGLENYYSPALMFEENHLTNFSLENCNILTSALDIDFLSKLNNNTGSYLFTKNNFNNIDKINFGQMRGYTNNSFYERGISLAENNNKTYSHARILPAGTISSYNRTSSSDNDVIAGSGVSEKLEPQSKYYILKSSSKFIPIKPGDILTINVYVKKSTNPLYKASIPKLVLNQNNNLGYLTKTVLYSFTDSTGDWERGIATLPAVNSSGIAEVYIECTGDEGSGYININAWSIT